MYSTTQLIGESKILRINQVVLIYFYSYPDVRVQRQVEQFKRRELNRMLRALNKNKHIFFDRIRLCYPRRFKRSIGDFAALRIR
jgi:hypothetical protein